MSNYEALKAAALGANLHGWTGIEDSLNADGYSRAMTRFIQHCRPSEILELLAALEEKDQELEKEGDILIDNMDSMRSWKQRAEAAEQREGHLKADVAVMGKRMAELESQLQSGFTPEAIAQEERAEKAEQESKGLEESLGIANAATKVWKDRAKAAEQRVKELESDVRVADGIIANHQHQIIADGNEILALEQRLQPLNFETSAEEFLAHCLKAEEISGDKQQARIKELIGWFSRYYQHAANPKWLSGHVAELCYFIIKNAQAEQRLQQPIKLPPLMPENIFGGTPQAHMVANSHNNAITACSMSIRDAGFKSECTVWKESKGE